MNISKGSKKDHEPTFSDYHSAFKETDPEFLERFEYFTFDEVADQARGDEKNRFLAILAALLGCQGTDEFRELLPRALNAQVTPIEVKEVVYQAVAYLGMGRVHPFLRAVNEELKNRGTALPLPPQATTTLENRLEAGEKAQVEIMGEKMKGFWKSGPQMSRHINTWLTDNCFGDYYTRTGLTYQQREMITFCFLFAQGGCEPQLISHAQANMRIGSSAEFLIQIVSQCIPYVGYPRCLNALRCVNEAAERMKEAAQ